ncbi:MAG: aromatic ring-hydroxylating dioxygenase subunit alpha [Alphaproteobacteria bacterium]|nr:MAG: aromatic ring-hydroxylating dioxygenase subunit alpha [Alphaproteobacteria bacterium]
MDGHRAGALARVLQPLATARGLPNEHYIDPAVYLEERQVLLFENWAGIATASDVPNAGDVWPVEFAGMPLVVVRGQDGAVRVFQNTCRHRGMILLTQPGNVRGTIRCPYHSWCYGLDGTLRATPHAGGPGHNLHPDVDRATLGLVEIPSAVWRDVVFVNVAGNAPPFEKYAAGLMARWAEFDQPMYHGGPDSSFEFDVACNWKLAVENYCESYHLPWVHPGLNSYSRLEDHYHIEAPGAFAGQGTKVYRQLIGDEGHRLPDFAGLSEFWNAGAEYVALFPNVMFGAHRDHAFVIILLPQGPERTLERNELYYAFDPATRPELADLVARNAAQWKSVLEEDLFVVEGMQKGRHGVHFDGGKFAPVMDSPTFVFHDWAARKLAAARARADG